MSETIYDSSKAKALKREIFTLMETHCWDINRMGDNEAVIYYCGLRFTRNRNKHSIVDTERYNEINNIFLLRQILIGIQNVIESEKVK